jgi:hypothetical protein
MFPEEHTLLLSNLAPGALEGWIASCSSALEQEAIQMGRAQVRLRTCVECGGVVIMTHVM